MGSLLHWAVVFLVVALVAALFGFGGVAGTAMEGARLLFWVAIVLFVVSLINPHDIGADKIVIADKPRPETNPQSAKPAGINAQPTLLFGAANGCFYQVPVANPASARCTPTPGAGKAYVTTPTIDAAGTGTDLIGNDDGNVYGFARR